MELCAATLLANLFQKVNHAFQLNHIDCYAWSDSTVALSWICNNSTKLPAFGANRVMQIQKSKLVWRYVPTQINPADCASRGITPSQLIDHELWWHGPSFLLQNSDDGTNFTGANKILKTLEKRERQKYEEEVQSALASSDIQWHFNPPSAPHFGGLWEAGVKSIKTQFYIRGIFDSSISNRMLSEFKTIMPYWRRSTKFGYLNSGPFSGSSTTSTAR